MKICNFTGEKGSSSCIKICKIKHILAFQKGQNGLRKLCWKNHGNILANQLLWTSSPEFVLLL